MIPFDNSYARLPDRFYEPATPLVAPSPSLLAANRDLAATMGIDPDWLASDGGLAMLTGRLPDGAEPIAMAYAGHQFGGWVPRLGDGRALLVGEVVGVDGVRRDIHLKGSGRTVFSRGGDGKAGVGPVLREYILCEAMHALGVPTTRALAAARTGETIWRQPPEPGAVFARVARSHVRVGTFQYFYAQQDTEGLRTLADYVIDRHYPEVAAAENRYQALLAAVLEAQARLVSHWMSLGFVHGVMNTDNMQIAGETIDYGPCAFVDTFRHDKVFSSIDRYGRYAWANQAPIAGWNLARLAETLFPLLHDDRERARDVAQGVLDTFAEVFGGHYQRRFSDKLGIGPDPDFVAATLDLLEKHELDFTLFFRHLTGVARGGPEDALTAQFADPAVATRWLRHWRDRLQPDGPTRMAAANPVFIPRNHRVEEAIQAAYRGDLAPFHRLVAVLAHPYDDQPDHADLEAPPQPGEVVHQTFCGT